MKHLLNQVISIGVKEDTPDLIKSDIRIINVYAIFVFTMIWLPTIALKLLTPDISVFLLFLPWGVASSLITLFSNWLGNHRVGWISLCIGLQGLILSTAMVYGKEALFHYQLIAVIFATLAYRFQIGSLYTAIPVIFSLASFVTTELGVLEPFVQVNLSDNIVEDIRTLNGLIAVLSTVIVVYVLRSENNQRLLTITKERNERKQYEHQIISMGENLSEAVYRGEREEGIIFANQAFCALFGYDSFEEVKQFGFTDFIADSDSLEALKRQVKESRFVKHETIKLLRKDGSQFWGRVSSKQSFTADGKIYFDGVISNIDKQLKHAQEVDKQRRFYEKILNNFPIQIAIFDKERRFIYVSANSVKSNNLMSDLIGKKLSHESRKVPELTEVVSQRDLLFDKAEQTSTTQSYKEFITEDGIEKIFIRNVFRVDHDGDMFFVGFSTDITDLEKAKVKLEKQQIQLNVAQRMAKVGDWYHELGTDELTWSPETYRIMGLPLDQTVPALSQHHKYLGKKGLDKLHELVEKAKTSGAGYKLEIKLNTYDGKKKTVKTHAEPLLNENGEVVALRGTIQDITQQRKNARKLERMNKQLTKANKELDQFVYSVSHDLRAPIATLMGLVELMELSDAKDERDNYLSLQKQNLNKLDGFIKDILSYSRNQRLKLNLESILLKDFVDDIVDQHTNFTESKPLSIKNKIPHDTVLNTDKFRLRVVLNNLISNAIRYQDKNKGKRFVKIMCVVSSNSIRISVSDNGVGIDEKFHKDIFGMFFRATTMSKGSGLGLYILKETVEKLDGRVSLESESGVGTTFHIDLNNVVAVKPKPSQDLLAEA